MICPSEPTRTRVKVSHVIVECRVINHHPLITVYTRYPIVARRTWPAAGRPSAARDDRVSCIQCYNSTEAFTECHDQVVALICTTQLIGFVLPNAVCPTKKERDVSSTTSFVLVYYVYSGIGHLQSRLKVFFCVFVVLGQIKVIGTLRVKVYIS